MHKVFLPIAIMSRQYKATEGCEIFKPTVWCNQIGTVVALKPSHDSVTMTFRDEDNISDQI